MSGGQLSAGPWLVFGDPDESEDMGQVLEQLDSLRMEVDALRKSVKSLQTELSSLRAETPRANLQLASRTEDPQAIVNKDTNNPSDNTHKWRFRRQTNRGPPSQSSTQGTPSPQQLEEEVEAGNSKHATQADLCRLRVDLETMAARLQKALDASSEAVDKKLTTMLNSHQQLLQSQPTSNRVKQASNGMRSLVVTTSREMSPSKDSRVLEQGQKQLLEAMSLQDTRVQRLELFLKALGANLPAVESSV